MTPGRGVRLRDRPVVDAAGKPIHPAAQRRTRHCWVQGPAQDPQEREGLVVAWARDPAGWAALVVYVLTEPGTEPGEALQAATVVHTWVPADRLRPA